MSSTSVCNRSSISQGALVSVCRRSRVGAVGPTWDCSRPRIRGLTPVSSKPTVRVFGIKQYLRLGRRPTHGAWEAWFSGAVRPGPNLLTCCNPTCSTQVVQHWSSCTRLILGITQFPIGPWTLVLDPLELFACQTSLITSASSKPMGRTTH